MCRRTSTRIARKHTLRECCRMSRCRSRKFHRHDSYPPVHGYSFDMFGQRERNGRDREFGTCRSFHHYSTR